ncbi:uncharacterized protein LOC131211472 [Anopheles bellator]|uniref:uncharacterized protein LOC131211472 n=1 Tax=Anopheles bellator TaxID=139047 RepID=UPI002647F3BD|nr:uncharacterized protein LOC131211472 [Anopheles bellator]
MSRPRHIYDVVIPLLSLSRVTGVVAFHLLGEPPYVRIKIMPVDCVALLLNLLVNCFCVYLNVEHNRAFAFTGSAVMDAGLGYLFPFGAICMMLVNCDNVLRRGTIGLIVAELYEVDRSLQRKSHRINHRRQMRLLMRILILLLSLVTIGTGYSLAVAVTAHGSQRLQFPGFVTNTFSYLVTGTEIVLVNFHFIIAARLVAFRFDEIERCLRKHLDAGQWWIERGNPWGRKTTRVDVIANLGDDFFTLVRIVARINRVYSNQLVLCISGVCFYSIFIIYATTFTIFMGRMEELRMVSVMLSAWAFMVAMMGFIFHAGVELSRSARNVAELLHHAVQREQDAGIRQKLLHFSQQILLRPPKLRSLFYEFNWKTMFRIFGFIVTYLVILMQFDRVSVRPAKE